MIRIQGQYSITIDDKGRMLLPSKLRRQIPGDTLVLTKGIQRCLWLFLPSGWDRLSEEIMSKTSIFALAIQNVQRRIVAPAETITIDKAGRIKLSLSLMRAMGISKACYLLGMGEQLEIWDEATLDHYELKNAGEVENIWEDFGGTDDSPGEGT